MRSLTLLAAPLAALALAGCGSGADDSEGAAKSNQVLEGTISDDMIAYDTLTSEPPPAKIEVDENEAGTGPQSIQPQVGGASPAPAPASPTPVATTEPAAPTPE
jgi:hypothetical protein